MEGRQAKGRQTVLFLKKKNQKNFSPLAPVGWRRARPSVDTGGTKSFFASFSLRGVCAVALSQKEDSCLPLSLAFPESLIRPNAGISHA
jgi:hypothetical protein